MRRNTLSGQQRREHSGRKNIIDSQRQRLRHWRIAIRHMGWDVGRQGMKDQEILALLHRLRRSTFLTRDEDF